MKAKNSKDLIERDQLYEEVWSTPMIHLGRKYGVSGTEIKRICGDLQIPVPAPGHWSRLEAGHSVPRPPLPPLVVRQPKVEALQKRQKPIAEH